MKITTDLTERSTSIHNAISAYTYCSIWRRGGREAGGLALAVKTSKWPKEQQQRRRRREISSLKKIVVSGALSQSIARQESSISRPSARPLVPKAASTHLSISAGLRGRVYPGQLSPALHCYLSLASSHQAAAALFSAQNHSFSILPLRSPRSFLSLLQPPPPALTTAPSSPPPPAFPAVPPFFLGQAEEMCSVERQR